MLPNFLVIGSQKAATTSIYRVFRQHPEIHKPARKEVNFFFLDKLYDRGSSYYESFFRNVSGNIRAIGEASPGYICKEVVPQRIRGLLPNVKLILIVRNPYQRAYSQYWDNRRQLNEPYTFDEAIEKYLSDDYQAGVGKGYFSRGIYIKYIERYLRYFSRDQLLVLLFDDLAEDPVGFYRTLFEFLNVDPDVSVESMQTASNAFSIHTNAPYRVAFSKPRLQKFAPKMLRKFLQIGPTAPVEVPPMDESSKQLLIEFYRPWNERLSDFLERDLADWNN